MDEKKIICAHCGCVIDDDDFYTIIIDGKEIYYCANCATTCADCGSVVLYDDAVEHEGDYYCEDCTVECACCGERIPRGEEYYCHDDGWNEHPLCEYCYNNEVAYCECCGEHFWDGDYVNWNSHRDQYMCDDCRRDYTVIGDYHDSHDDDIIFMPENRPGRVETRKTDEHIGIELEVDEGSDGYKDDRDNMVIHIRDVIFADEDIWHFEDDGSLSDDGWENISQPGTLKYWLDIKPKMAEMFEYLSKNGVRSHEVKTCGLHMHLDKMYFGNSASQDAAIAKMLYLFEKFRIELTKFSRRNNGQIVQWTKFMKPNIPAWRAQSVSWICKTIEDYKKGFRWDRYCAVNLTNRDTIEIRLWRGTLNLNTFYATLKLTFRITDLCKNTKSIPLSKMSWEDILGDDPDILTYWETVKDRIV